MSYLSQLRMGERLGALALLMLLLAVLAGVSLTQAGLLDQSADRLEDEALPALRRVHDVRRLVDAARGLEALQLLAADDAERASLAEDLQRQRQRVQAQLAGAPARGEDSEERRLKALVSERLAQYWSTQDQVIARLQAASMAADPAAATAAARQLLAQESQEAWQAVGQALGFWYQHQEQRAADIARHSRSQAGWWRWGLASVLAALALASVAVVWRRRARRAAHADRAPGATLAEAVAGLPETLDTIAMHSRLVALNAAVQAARTGNPSAADLAERVHLASEAEALARRCDAARRELRLSRPRARPLRSLAGTAPPGSGFGATTQPPEPPAG